MSIKKFVSHFSDLKKIFRMLSETNGTMSMSDNQNQKSHVAVEKASSSSSKEEWRTYLAHILLIS